MNASQLRTALRQLAESAHENGDAGNDDIGAEAEAMIRDLVAKLAPAPLADPLNGHVIKPMNRDPKDPANFPCCGGPRLTGTHTSRCRVYG